VPFSTESWLNCVSLDSKCIYILLLHLIYHYTSNQSRPHPRTLVVLCDVVALLPSGGGVASLLPAAGVHLREVEPDAGGGGEAWPGGGGASPGGGGASPGSRPASHSELMVAALSCHRYSSSSSPPAATRTKPVNQLIYWQSSCRWQTSPSLVVAAVC